MDIEILVNRLLEYALNENATEYDRQVMADAVHELSRLLMEKNLAENRAERHKRDAVAFCPNCGAKMQPIGNPDRLNTPQTHADAIENARVQSSKEETQATVWNQWRRATPTQCRPGWHGRL